MQPPELNAEVSVPVVLVSRESLYVIIAVLSASVLGCVTVLTYSLSNYNNLRRNAEEVRNYIASRAKVAEKKKSGYGGAEQRAASGLSAPAHTPAPASSAPGSQNTGMSREGGVPFIEPAKDKPATVARQVASSAENLTLESRHEGTDPRGGTEGPTTAVQAAASVEETMRPTAAANTSSSDTVDGFAEAA